MDYYVIYDINDVLIAYLDNLDELANFVNRPKKELKYRFKTKNIVQVQLPKVYNIFKFIS